MYTKFFINFIVILGFAIYKYIFPSSFFINFLFFIYFFIILYYFFIFKKDILLKKIINFIVLLSFFIFTIGLTTIILDIKNNKTIEVKNDYVIILGAGLKGDKPKSVLKYRLNKALEYYKKYPNTIFIVSGGQGKDEIISESEAMKNYLVLNHIPAKQIIKENKSKTTLENLLFSKKLIPLNIKNIGVISNDFHLYRVKFLAKTINFNINPIYAKTPFISLFSLYTRETIAVIYYYIKNLNIFKNTKTPLNLNLVVFIL
jgi:uncharacterized SAM-binding protein YcdF (DUF218 family)